MASIINASTSSGIVQTADTSGVLELQNNGTTAVTVTGGNVGIGTSSPAGKLSVGTAGISDASLVVQINAAASSEAYIGLNKAGGYGGLIGYSNSSYFGGPSLVIRNVTTTDPILFVTNNNVEAMRINSAGNVLIDRTSAYTDGTLGTARFQVNGVVGVRAAATFIADTTGSINIVGFVNSNGTIGTINLTGSTTTYNTSSDYRLKENIAPMTGALDTVAKLKPVTYKWKADGSDGQGFIAHELQAVVPNCVTGEKDAVDADGKPVHQGIDTSFLVATLTAAIQELSAKVDAQALEIQALKGAA